MDKFDSLFNRIQSHSIVCESCRYEYECECECEQSRAEHEYEHERLLRGSKPSFYVPSPPTLKEVEDYCVLKGYRVDPIKFHDYYCLQYWQNEKGEPIVFWQGVVDHWEKRVVVSEGLESEAWDRNGYALDNQEIDELYHEICEWQ